MPDLTALSLRPRLCRGGRVGLPSDRGSLAVEYVLVMAVFVVVFMVLVQFAVNGFAQRAADSAAEDALSAAGSYRGSAQEGRAAGRDALAHVGGGLRGTTVTISRTDQTAAATVTGRAPRLVPGIPVDIRATVRGPVERFVDAP